MSSRDTLVQRLLASESVGRGHHAYLFSGPQGAGSESILERLCAGWMSPNAESDSLTLSKIQRRIHPDLIWIKPEGRTLKVDEVRDLPKQLSYAPLEAKKRVIVLVEAEKMSISAANALLKLLEEPPSTARFVLLVDDANRVLETIRSRCQGVPIPPMGREEIAQELTNQYPDMEESLIREGAGLASGSQSQAEVYLENEEDRKLVHKSLQAILAGWKNPYMVPAETIPFIDLVKRYDQAKFILRAWLAMISDLMRVRESKRMGLQCNGKELVFARYLNDVEGFVQAEGVDSPRIERILDRLDNISGALRALEGNANVRLTLTTLMLDLQAGHVR